jgi:hypothetical protein
MLTERNEYIVQFMDDALKTTLRLFDTSLPGKLLEFSLSRSGAADSMTVKFTADERPGVVFSYEFPVFDGDSAPVRGVHLDVSVFLAGIMERTHRWSPTPRAASAVATSPPGGPLPATSDQVGCA